MTRLVGIAILFYAVIAFGGAVGGYEYERREVVATRQQLLNERNANQQRIDRNANIVAKIKAELGEIR
jgi:hypothetical protein